MVIHRTHEREMYFTLFFARIGALRTAALVASVALTLAACGDDDTPTPAVDAGSDAFAVTQCASDSDCSDSLFCDGIEHCAPASPVASPHGCVAGLPPCAAALCDDTTDTCADGCPDADGDGYTTCAGDCDDHDASRYPGATEVCDGDDEDCNDATIGVRDIDGDGYTDDACCNGPATCGNDCDDTRAGAHPGLPEVCNRRDDDCNGLVDDDDAIVFAVYPDLDRDGDGDSTGAPLLLCPGLVGFASIHTDCADAPGPVARLRSGRTPEVTDGVDNDCDGLIDEASPPATWFEDRDGDGYGTRTSTRASTTVLTGYALLEGDCNDADPYVNPGAPRELCNALDDDCDGVAGFDLGVNDFEDDDGDGFADVACGEAGTDCDDGDPVRHPGAVERCNGLDDDCDGAVDEACVAPPPDAGVPDAGAPDGGAGFDAGGFVIIPSPGDAGTTADAGVVCTAPEPLFPDADGDGYGTSATYVVAYCPLAGYSTLPTDCNDADAAIHPGAGC